MSVNKEAMSRKLNQLGRSLSTLLKKINGFKRQATKDKYLEIYNQKLTERNQLEQKLLRERQHEATRKSIKEHKRLQAETSKEWEKNVKEQNKEAQRIKKIYKQVEKRERKINRERAAMQKRFQKLEKEDKLRSRLLTEEQKLSLINESILGNISQKELNKKLRDSNLEKFRRKRNLKKQGMDLRNPFKRNKVSLDPKNSALHRMLRGRGAHVSVVPMRNGRRVVNYELNLQGGTEGIAFRDYLDIMKVKSLEVIREHRNQRRVKLIFQLRFIKPSTLNPDRYQERTSIISTTFKNVFFATDLIKFYEEEKRELMTKYHKVLFEGSGWIFDKVLKYNIQISNYAPHNGNENLIGQGPRDIPLGEASDFNIGQFWKDKHAIVVPETKSGDAKCFLDAVGIAMLKPKSNKGRITLELKEFKEKMLDTKGVRFPPNRHDIEHFEKINGIKIHCMAANVHKKEVFHYKPAIAPDILLILMFNRNNKAHWCVIPDDKHFSRLISAQQSNHKGALHVCSNCHFVNPPTKEGLKKHQELCLENKPQILTFPKTIKGEEIKFKNVCKEEKVPIVFCCDFESRVKKT